jgi:protein-tyrosine phosphatase
MDNNTSKVTHSVLFVCTYNLCRSPMAAALFTDMVGPDEISDWNIGSAGTWAKNGLPALDLIKQLMGMNGLDIEDHLSREITKDILASYSLVLTMERGHKEALVMEYPEMENKIFMLSEMSGTFWSIPDPIGLNLHQYNQIANEIKGWLNIGKSNIYTLAVDKEKTPTE